MILLLFLNRVKLRLSRAFLLKVVELIRKGAHTVYLPIFQYLKATLVVVNTLGTSALSIFNTYRDQCTAVRKTLMWLCRAWDTTSISKADLLFIYFNRTRIFILFWTGCISLFPASDIKMRDSATCNMNASGAHISGVTTAKWGLFSGASEKLQIQFSSHNKSPDTGHAMVVDNMFLFSVKSLAICLSVPRWVAASTPL